MNTNTLVILAVAGVGLYLLTRPRAGGAVTDPTLAAAQAEARARIAEAEAAKAAAEAAGSKTWMDSIAAGIGASLPVFAGSLSGMFD